MMLFTYKDFKISHSANNLLNKLTEVIICSPHHAKQNTLNVSAPLRAKAVNFNANGSSPYKIMIINL